VAISSANAESTAFGQRLRRIFARELPTDEAARAAIERMDEAQRRIDAVKKEVTNGIRRRDGRFHL
jgi:hypothetical protein